jgi:hypothetical protein
VYFIFFSIPCRFLFDSTFTLNCSMIEAPRAKQQYKYVISGAAAGLVSAILVCPLDVVKFRLQASTSKNRGMKNTLVHIAKNEGLPGLFSGLQPTGMILFPYLSFGFHLRSHVMVRILRIH